MAGLLSRGNLSRPDHPAQIRILAKFHHDLSSSFAYKNAFNEHSFPMVTHTAYFDTWFGRYGFLKSGYGAKLIPDRTGR
jgi:hypothetical protein